MSSNSVLLAQRRGNSVVSPPIWETLCPALRLPLVTAVQTHSANPGGYIDASFVIPAARARLAPEQYGTRENPNICWIYDGLRVIFYGLLTKTVRAANGDIQCFVDGPYKLLAETRMREVWGDKDLSVLTPSPDNAKAAVVSTDSNGDVTLGFPKGAAPSSGKNIYNQGDHAAADYFLFGEQNGPRDTKRLTGWDVQLGGDFGNAGSFEVRIYGMHDPVTANPDLLQTFQTTGSRIETADTTHGGENTVAWQTISGYRCFRIGLWQAVGIGHLDDDVTVKVKRFHVSSRAIVPSPIKLSSTPSTTDIVRDIWIECAQASGFQSKDLDAFLQEENSSTVGGMITGNIQNSAQGADSINYTDWVSPQEIIEDMTNLDGFKVGFYEPTLDIPPNALVTSGSQAVNYWHRQPPELKYEAWGDIADPHYHVRLNRGAQWVPDTESDQTKQAVYVNYSDLRGRTKSVYVEQNDVSDRMFEQGRHTAVDWAIDPSVGGDTAITLAGQFLQGALQPVLSGQLTITGDRPGSIEFPGGGRIVKLSDIKPGVIRIVDAKGAKAGRVTDLTYTARTDSTPETLVLTLNSPISARLDRNLARLSHRADTSRKR